jgi:hypothetical protein
MRTLTFVMIAALVAAGCGPPTFKPTKPTERAGGVISQVHDKVDEAVVMQMMHELHLYVLQEESGGAMPTREQIREYANKESPSLKKVLDKDWIIIPPKPTRGGIWAYQKDTPEKGGWIAVQAGTRKVTAEEYKELAGK